MRVMGINPVQALVVPRVLAGTVVSLMLFSLVTLAGLAGSFFFSVYVQNVTPGAWAASLTLLTGLSDVIVAMIKAMFFGLAASLIACYKGITVGGGPQGVGNAVNETVIFAFMALFAVNVVMTAIGVQLRPQ
jgi:phospholipid/cholesterol/gamma-HCH transport system permease protein